MDLRAGILGMVFCVAAGVPVQAHSETPQGASRQFSSPVDALKSVIRSGGLEYFPARQSFTEQEWLATDDGDVAAMDMALSVDDQWRFVPEKVLFSPVMASRRWEKAGDDVLMLRAIATRRGANFLDDEDFRHPERFWTRETGGQPFVCRLIESKNLGKVDAALFRATPHRLWKETSCDGKPVTEVMAGHGELMKGFFAAHNWIGRVDDMKETYGWIVASIPKTGLRLPLSSPYSSRNFEILHKEAEVLTRDRVQRRQRLQINAAAHGVAGYPPA